MLIANLINEWKKRSVIANFQSIFVSCYNWFMEAKFYDSTFCQFYMCKVIKQSNVISKLEFLLQKANFFYCQKLRLILPFQAILQLADDCISDCLILANSSFVIPVVWCFMALFLAALIFQGIFEELGSPPSRENTGSSFPVENSLRATGSLITWFLLALFLRWISSSSILLESTGFDEDMVPVHQKCFNNIFSKKFYRNLLNCINFEKSSSIKK